MATLTQIHPDGPILIDPAQHDLDHPGLQVGVEDAQPIILEGEQAAHFMRWVRIYWRGEFEQDLQAMCVHEQFGDLLTTFVPLVTFREDLCCRANARRDDAIMPLLDDLRAATRAWRAAGVDTVSISGRDNRAHTDAPRGITHVDRIIGIAAALAASNGRDRAGASTGELIAGALVAGHPEWGGYTDDAGYTDVVAMIERLGAQWLEYVREAQSVR